LTSSISSSPTKSPRRHGRGLGRVVFFAALHGRTAKPGMWQSAARHRGRRGHRLRDSADWENYCLAARNCKLPPDTKIIFTETAVCLPDKEIPYEKFFTASPTRLCCTQKRSNWWIAATKT
jgi:hypothetical protein